MAIACAAFCIPTSMTIVRRTASFKRAIRERSELHNILIKISKPQDVPMSRKLSKISLVYCRKNRKASSINAGKANLPRIFPTLAATEGLRCRKSHPANSGRNSVTRFCINSLPTGSSIVIPSLCDTYSEVSSIITGSVNSVSTLLTAVSVTDRATSPLASIEKTLEELPPGQQAISTNPIKYIGETLSSEASRKAIEGNRTNCPTIPKITALGLRTTFIKASLLSSVPSRNIRTMRMGITIQIVFIRRTNLIIMAKGEYRCKLKKGTQMSSFVISAGFKPATF